MKSINRWKAIFPAVVFALTVTACAGGKKPVDTAAPAGLPETAAGAAETKASSEPLEELLPAPAAVAAENSGLGSFEAEGERTAEEAFAERIQEAVADKDMAVMADLLIYPCRIVIPGEEELTVDSREEFLKLNPDRVFGDDLMVAAATVDTGELVQENGRVFMGDGEAGITFTVSGDGQMGIELIHQ